MDRDEWNIVDLSEVSCVDVGCGRITDDASINALPVPEQFDLRLISTGIELYEF